MKITTVTKTLQSASLAGTLMMASVIPMAQAEDSEDGFWHTVTEPASGLWSVGAVARDSSFRDVDVEVNPALLVFGGYGDFFIEANRFGYGVYRDGTNFASVIGNLRTHTSLSEEQIDDSDVLSAYDLDERDSALEIGFQVGRRLGAGWVGRAAVLQDISGAHQSQEAELLFYRRDDVAGFRILTTVGAQYQTEDFNDYYFGIDRDEIRNSASQDVYDAGPGFSAELEIIATYDFNWGNQPDNKWGAYVGLRHFQYDDEVSDSPLVGNGLVQQYFVGLGKYF